MEPLKYILLFFVVTFVAIQFYTPQKNTGEMITKNSFVSLVETPMEIQIMLKKSCYDCHSDFTKYPWYAEISPISWYIASNIKKAKAGLNFSTWGGYTATEKDKKIIKIGKMIKRRWMPLHDYIAKHPEAYMSNDDVSKYSEWFFSL